MALPHGPDSAPTIYVFPSGVVGASPQPTSGIGSHATQRTTLLRTSKEATEQRPYPGGPLTLKAMKEKSQSL